MGLESVTTIGGLVTANPVGATDPKSQGDDHIRMIKNVLKTTFPNLNGVTTVTPAQLNQLDTANPAITLPVGTKMLFVQTAAPTGWTKSVANDNAALRIVSGAAGTGGTADFTTVFASRTPTGDNAATALTTANLPSHTHPFSISVNSGGASVDHQHFVSANTGTESVSHVHGIYGPILGNMAHDGSSEGDFGVGNFFSHNSGGISANHYHGIGAWSGGINQTHIHGINFSGTTSGTGSGTAHDHAFTGVAMDFAVKYVDAIVCTKD